MLNRFLLSLANGGSLYQISTYEYATGTVPHQERSRERL